MTVSEQRALAALGEANVKNLHKKNAHAFTHHYVYMYIFIFSPTTFKKRNQSNHTMKNRNARNELNRIHKCVLSIISKNSHGITVENTKEKLRNKKLSIRRGVYRRSLRSVNRQMNEAMPHCGGTHTHTHRRIVILLLLPIHFESEKMRRRECISVAVS